MGIGAWEHQAGSVEPRVTIGMPHREITHMKWAIGLSGLQKPPNTSFSLSKGTPWDVARNLISKDAMNNGSTHLLFLDTDVVPPVDGLMRLLSHNLPIVSGLYYCRHRTDFAITDSLPISLPPTPAMWLDNGAGAYAPVTRWSNQLMQCNVVGAGFVLIHTSVFERLDRDLDRKGIYFKWTSGIDNEEYCEHQAGVSEDFFFCRLVEKLGIPIFVDTTIKCDHMSMSTTINEKGLDFSGV